MRSDLGKCVTERPRRNSSAASVKATWYGRIHEDDEGQLDYDGLTRLPASRRQEGYHKKIGDKSFSDVLGPIEGYLRSSVGRPWNDVYSELSRNLGSGSWPVRHVLTQHVDVATKTYRGIDGKVYYHDRRGPNVVDGSYGSEFYVHPETGTLRQYPKKSWKYRPKPAREDTDRVKADNDQWYVKINGLWFLGAYRFSSKGAAGWPNFLASGREGVWVFRKIKSCSKKELKNMRSSKLPQAR
jgi:hypothetical protein